MKKSIIVILAMTLILSSIASASFLEILFGQASITGQQTLIERNVRILPTPMYGGFNGAVSKGTKFNHGADALLSNGVTAKSEYNAKDKTATITFSKTLFVSNNQMLRFHDGSYIATLKNTPLLPNGLTIQRKGKGIVSAKSELTKSLLTNNMFGDKAFLAFGKQTRLVNGFSAMAERGTGGISKMKITKTITLKDGEEIALTDEKLGVSIDKSGVTFHTPRPATNARSFVDPSEMATSGFATVEEWGFVKMLEPIQMPETMEGREQPARRASSPGQVAPSTAKIFTCKDIFIPGKLINYVKESELKGFTAATSYDTAKKTATMTFTKTLTLSNGQAVKTDDGIWTAIVSEKGVSFVKGNKKVDGALCTANDQCISKNCGYALPDNTKVLLGSQKKCIAAKKAENSQGGQQTDLLISR